MKYRGIVLTRFDIIQEIKSIGWILHMQHTSARTKRKVARAACLSGGLCHGAEGGPAQPFSATVHSRALVGLGHLGCCNDGATPALGGTSSGNRRKRMHPKGEALQWRNGLLSRLGGAAHHGGELGGFMSRARSGIVLVCIYITLFYQFNFS